MRSRDPRAVRSFGVTPSPAALSCRTRSVCARTTSRRSPACSAPQETVHSPLSPGFSGPGVRGRQGGRSPASGAASRAAWARTHGPFLSRPAPAAGRRHVPAPARHPCSERHLRLRGPSGARPAAASHCAAVRGDALSLLGPPGPSSSLRPGFFFFVLSGFVGKERVSFLICCWTLIHKSIGSSRLLLAGIAKPAETPAQIPAVGPGPAHESPAGRLRCLFFYFLCSGRSGICGENVLARTSRVLETATAAV